MKKTIALFSALLILAGCSSGAAGQDSEAAEYYYDEGAGIADYSAVNTQEMREDAEAGETKEDELSSQKLVYSGSIEIETLTYEETAENVRRWISTYGVMIERENAYDYDNSWRGYGSGRGTRALSMTLRVPSERFYDFINDLQGTGKVRSLSTNIDNITKRYSSVSTEIESLEIQQDRLLDMLRDAETVEDMLTVERRLSEVESDLKNYRNQLSSMDTDLAWSTVYLNVTEVTEYTETQSDLYTGNFGQRLMSTLQWAGQFFVWLIQQIILTLVRLIPVAVIAAPLIWLIRRFGPKMKIRRKKEEKGEKIL